MTNKRKRALSPSEVLRIKHKTFPMTGRWKEALGTPAVNGVWVIYGASGNGKSSFVMQLAKELCKYDRVIYNSLEEGFAKSFSDSLKRHKMEEVNHRLELYEFLPMDELKQILLAKRRPNIAIVDSLQLSSINRKDSLLSWLKKLEKKLVIFILQADERGKPFGSAAIEAEFISMIKIHVNGMRAECKSRFSADKDKEKGEEKIGYFDIWQERAVEVWSTGNPNEMKEYNERQTS